MIKQKIDVEKTMGIVTWPFGKRNYFISFHCIRHKYYKMFEKGTSTVLFELKR